MSPEVAISAGYVLIMTAFYWIGSVLLEAMGWDEELCHPPMFALSVLWPLFLPPACLWLVQKGLRGTVRKIREAREKGRC